MSGPAISTHQTLLARLADGADPGAWREFRDRYALLIRRFAEQQRLQPADCEDVVQDVFMALTKAMPDFTYDPARGLFRSYLKTIVVHAVQRFLRQKRGVDGLGDMDQPGPSGPETDERWEKEWRQYHLREALRIIEVEFNSQDRAAFDRYVLSGMGAAETATALGLSIEQVYQAKSRILRRLTQIIEARVREEG